MEAEAQKQKDVAPWMALAEAGFATAAGSSPFALQNIGAGALMGTKSYGAAQEKYQNKLEKLDSLRNDIALQDRKIQLAIAEHGARSKQAYDELAAKDRMLDKELRGRREIAAMEIQGRKDVMAMRPTKPMMTADQLIKAKDKIAESEEVAQWQNEMIKSKGKNVVNTKEFQVGKQALINRLLQQKLSSVSPYAGVEYLGIEED